MIQLAAVQQESLYLQYMNNVASTAAAPVTPDRSLAASMKATFISGNSYGPSISSGVSDIKSSSSENSAESLQPEMIVRKLRER